METGIIVAIHADRGFGFVKRSTGGQDVFFHMYSVADQFLQFDDRLRGRKVTFDIETESDGTGRQRAVNVRAAT